MVDVGGASQLWEEHSLGNGLWTGQVEGVPGSQPVRGVHPQSLLQFLIEFLPWLTLTMDCGLKCKPNKPFFLQVFIDHGAYHSNRKRTKTSTCPIAVRK